MTDHRTDTPVAAVQALWQYLAAADLDRAYQVLSARDRGAASLDRWRAAALGSPDFSSPELNTGRRARDQEFVLEEDGGDQAVVAARFTIVNPRTQQPYRFEFRYQVVRQDDGWHVYLGLDRSPA